ncbi:MAG: ABC transporter ATP-binding protein [Candidatus Bathyarchaeia archaeon]|jgi:NitT/TauT family transport system ATP-binding protein|nr:ABC transporter ATP-binding protein [Candidatus Bathyarchaeota archaeon A05DMB-4]MDH7595680.1 ABC transporter ATP-binding protein [Candidatus Bathyarchaeota archaeon]
MPTDFLSTRLLDWETVEEALCLSQPKVVVENLSKTYITKDGTQVEALENITFHVNEQELLCIIGPNGCGKTTLLRLIAGIDTPTRGRILIDNQETKPGRAALIFQEFSLFPWRTVLDNIKFGLEILNVPTQESHKIAQNYVKLVGLEGFEQKFPHELSEGMKQKVAIARALAVNPPVLLLDEPFAFLDAQTRNRMQEELLRIWEQEKKTMIFVSHNVDEAVYLADRILALTARPGKVKTVCEVALRRPRQRTSQPFIRKREEMLKTLIEELDT